ncbi:subclass B1 metallo-beta-lactamase [Myxococcota bacterium]|nr:subclass B1 metallo-beta-lactamase [Myxococcota bacterium]
MARPVSARGGHALACAALVLGGCAASTPRPAPPEAEEPSLLTVLAPDVQLLEVTKRVYVHITKDETDRWGTVPANGLLLFGDDDALLVDTGWKPGQTELLLRWAADVQHKPVRRVVVTHAHTDRIGGIFALTASTTVYAQEITVKRLERLGVGVNVEAYEDRLRLDAAGQEIEVYYPGAGHSEDNAVVWLPEDLILFAGCLVKSSRATELGNREDAVISDWPFSVLKLLEHFGDAELVIPGHGPPGRIDLVSHTLGLLEQTLSTTSPY